MKREDIQTILDKLILAHGRNVRAGIDAATCGTDFDCSRELWPTFRKAYEADEAYNEAYEEAVKSFAVDLMSDEVVLERFAVLLRTDRLILVKSAH